MALDPRSCFCPLRAETLTYSVFMLYLRFVRDLASTTWLQAAVHCCVPGIRHSAICVIPGCRQVRISVIVPSSRKLGTRIFRNRPVPSRPVPEIRYVPPNIYGKDVHLCSFVFPAVPRSPAPARFAMARHGKTVHCACT